MSVVVKIEGVTLDAEKLTQKSTGIDENSQGRKSLALSLYYTASEGLPAEGQDIQVFEDATLKFGGIIKTMDPIPLTPGQTTLADLKCRITSNGYNNIPQRRTIATNYTNTTAGAIVTAMVTSFLYQEGVTVGTIQTGATIDSYPSEFQSIKEVLDDMADASGYIWNINDDKSLDFKAVATAVISADTILTDDGKHFNFRPGRTLKGFRNKQHVVGGLDDTGAVVRAIVEDSANIAARALAEGNSGVYGNVYRDTTIQTTADATAVATELLNRYIVPARASVQTYGSLKTLTVGTIIEVTYPKYSIAASTQYLVVSGSGKRDAHDWVYTYQLEARVVADFSSKPRGNAVDFFSKLVRPQQLASGGGGTDVDIFVGPDVPTGAKAKSIHIDTNDFTSYDTQVISTTSIITVDDKEVIFASGTITLTLPDMSSVPHPIGFSRIIKNVGTGVVTLDGYTTDTIDDALTFTLDSLEFVEVEFDGTEWWVIRKSAFLVNIDGGSAASVYLTAQNIDGGGA